MVGVEMIPTSSRPSAGGFNSVASEDAEEDFVDEPSSHGRNNNSAPSSISPDFFPMENGHDLTTVKERRFMVVFLVILSVSFLMMLTLMMLHKDMHPSNRRGDNFGGAGGGVFTRNSRPGRRRFVPPLLTDIDVYPGYNGSLTPRGRITVRFEDDETEMLIRYELEGLEANCDGCGIHIHKGDSCEESGDHYFAPYNGSDNPDQTTMVDPWKLAVYNSNDEGVASNALVMPLGGDIGSKTTMGHALVIHAQDGTRIGCGILKRIFNINVMEAEIGLYPGYVPTAVAGGGSQKSMINIAPNGTVRLMVFEDDVVRIRGSVDGLESNCTKCGLHIHAGLACDNVDDVGDHWYNHEVILEVSGDPWTAQRASYSSDRNGHAEFGFYVYNGYDYENNVDHVVVLHDKMGLVWHVEFSSRTK